MAVLPPPLLVHLVVLVGLPLLDAIAPELCPERVVDPHIFEPHQPINRVAVLEDLIRPVAGVEPIGIGATRHRTVASQPVLVVGIAVRVARHRELDRFERHEVRFRVSSHEELELPVTRLRLGQAGPEVTAVPAPNRIHVDLVTSPLPHVDTVAVRLHLVRVVGLHVRQVDQAGDVVTLLERRCRIVARVDPVRLRPARHRALAHHAIRLEVICDVRLHEHIGVVPEVLHTAARSVPAVGPVAVTAVDLREVTLMNTDVDVRGPPPIVFVISQVTDRGTLRDALTDANLQGIGVHVTDDRGHAFGARPALHDDRATIAIDPLGKADLPRTRCFDGRAD